MLFNARQQNKAINQHGHSLADKIRRSSSGFLSRARVRTLKMTITIIAVFIMCWSPYYVMSVW